MPITYAEPDLLDSVEVDTTLASEPICEHSEHLTRSLSHADGSGLFSVLVLCECGGTLAVFCGAFVEHFQSKPYLNLNCSCGRILSPLKAYYVLEKVK